MDIAVMPHQISLWLKKPSAILQVSGPSGAGKTSALLAIKKELARQGLSSIYFYVPVDQDEPVLEDASGRPLLLDEAQRLSRRSLLKLFRAAKFVPAQQQSPSLVISTHKDFSADARRLSVDFTSVELGGMQDEDLELMLGRRIQHFASKGLSPVHFQPAALRFLAETFGADLRSMEAFLYEFFQSIPTSPEIEVQVLRERYRG